MALNEAGGPDWPVLGGATAAILTATAGLLKVFSDRRKSQDEQDGRDERYLSERGELVFKQARELLEQQRIDMVRLMDEKRNDNAELRAENDRLRAERDRLWSENTGLRQELRRAEHG